MTILRNILFIYIGNVYSLLLRMVSLILLARIFSQTVYGEIKIAEAMIGASLPLVLLGLDNAVLKFCSEEYRQKTKEMLFSLSFYVIVFVSFLWTVVYFFCVFQNNRLNILNGILIWMTPFLALNDLAMSFLYSQKKFGIVSLINMIILTIEVMLLILGSYFWGPVGWAFGKLLTAIIGFIIFLFAIKTKIALSMNWRMLKRIFSFCFYDWVAAIFSGLHTTSPLFIAALLKVKPDDIGSFTIVAGILGGIRFVPQAVISVFTPDLSKFSYNKEVSSKIMRDSILWVSIISILMFAGILLTHEFLLNVLFDNHDPITGQILIIMSFCMIFEQLYIIFLNALMSSGNTKYTAVSNIIYLLFIISFVTVGVILNGIIGLCSAICVSIILGCTVNYFLYRRQFNNPHSTSLKGILYEYD